MEFTTLSQSFNLKYSSSIKFISLSLISAPESLLIFGVAALEKRALKVIESSDL
jgi:hypothetical protein